MKIQKAIVLRVMLLAIATICALPLTVEAQQAKSVWPRLRHIDPAARLPEVLPQKPLRLLVADDFAPFTFKSASAQWSGASLELALAACAELKLACDTVEKPFAELVPALQRKEGDVIITGHRMTGQLAKTVDATKPYYMSAGRFLARAGLSLEGADVRTLAGKRLGYVMPTTHGKFIETYYQSSQLLPFKTETEAFEALRTGALDVIFVDALHGAYWLQGALSRSCCTTLGSAYIDRDGFSQSMSLLLPKDRQDLRIAFDYALDQLEKSGKSAEIFNRYMPAGLW
jgi:polar amino acid transport system substrate-binding protein